MTKSEAITSLPQPVNEINIALLVILAACAIIYAVVRIQAWLSDRALMRKVNREAAR